VSRSMLARWKPILRPIKTNLTTPPKPGSVISFPDRPGAPPRSGGVRERASRVLQEARNGGDFATLAQRHSEDATAANGGDLGVIRRGQALPGLKR
jgi:hypothetical protein